MELESTDLDSRIEHRQVDPHPEEGGIDMVELIADLEDKGPTELDSLYERVDNMLSELFSNPPSPEAQVELSFTYSGYRINVDQAGHVRLMPID